MRGLFRIHLAEFSIEDSVGKVMIPCILYKSDRYHIECQRAVLLETEEGINSINGYILEIDKNGSRSYIYVNDFQMKELSGDNGSDEAEEKEVRRKKK